MRSAPLLTMECLIVHPAAGRTQGSDSTEITICDHPHHMPECPHLFLHKAIAIKV